MEISNWIMPNKITKFYLFSLSQFMLTVAYQGENQAEWSERLRMLKTWRGIADQFPVFVFLFLMQFINNFFKINTKKR